MSDTGAILIPFSFRCFFFFFFLQSIKFDIDPLRVSIDPFVVLQEYIAGKWEMPCYRR